jgi:hypothetical protein
LLEEGGCDERMDRKSGLERTGLSVAVWLGALIVFGIALSFYGNHLKR